MRRIWILAVLCLSTAGAVAWASAQAKPKHVNSRRAHHTRHLGHKVKHRATKVRHRLKQRIRKSAIVSLKGWSAKRSTNAGVDPVLFDVLFDDQTIEATTNGNQAGLAEAFPFSNSTAGTTAAISVHVDASNAAKTLLAGLYSDRTRRRGSGGGTTAAPSNTTLPAISGTDTQGQPLTTTKGSWTGSPTFYAYQWRQCDSSGNNCTNVSGATASSYTLTSGDVGHTIRAVVTATNAGGSTPATSNQTSAVQAAPPAPPSNTTLPAISGTATQGQTLTTSNGSWNGNPTSYAYQWRDCDSSGSSCTNINGATQSNYTVASGDVGHTLRSVVTATNAAGSASATSAQTALVPDPSAPPPSTGCSPSASATMTNTVSHLCGFADTTNTGVPAGTTLYNVPGDVSAPTAATGSGWSYSNHVITLGTGGTVKNVELNGVVSITGANATVEDSDISVSGEDTWAVQLRHASNATIEDNNLHGVGLATGDSCDSGVRDIYSDSENMTVEHNNVWYCSDPMNNITLGGLIEENYFHDLGASTTDNHYECIQTEDPGSSTALIIRDNTCFNQHTDQTAAIILSNDNGGTENNRYIDHNLLAGGGYTFYGSGGPTAPATNITFINNHFTRIFTSGSGGYGPIAYWKTGGGNVWSGNVWDDTGQSISP